MTMITRMSRIGLIGVIRVIVFIRDTILAASVNGAEPGPDERRLKKPKMTVPNSDKNHFGRVTGIRDQIEAVDIY